MNWLINLLGGYTEEEYSSKTQELNRIIDKKDKEIQSCRTDIMESHSKNEQLKQEIEKLKDTDSNLRDIAKLKEEIKQFEQTNGKLIKELASLKPKETQSEWYRMYVDFKDMFIIENGVKYLCGEKFIGNSNVDNNFLKVYNAIWGNDKDKKVTFKEFNDEYNKLYNNRNSELIDRDLRDAINNIEKYFKEMKESSKMYHTYNNAGHLIYKSSGNETH